MAELFAFGGNTIALNVTTALAAVSLGGTTGQQGKVLRIWNSGDVPVFIATGADSATAAIPANGTPANGMPIAPGATIGISLQGSQTHIAAITASGAATIYVTQGSGI